MEFFAVVMNNQGGPIPVRSKLLPPLQVRSDLFVESDMVVLAFHPPEEVDRSPQERATCGDYLAGMLDGTDK